MQFLDMVSVLLVWLKLTGVKDYSWIVVLTPVMLRYLLSSFAFLFLIGVKEGIKTAIKEKTNG